MDHRMSCLHVFVPSTQPLYDECVRCGTFHSISAPPSEEVYTSDYWTHEAGHSTLEEQVYNCDVLEIDGKTKNQFLLDRINVKDRLEALEIGCAPGSMLIRLKYDAGFEYVAGIEFSEALAKETSCRINHQFPVLGARFPGALSHISRPAFDLILASDTFEHSHEPQAFLAECARLLKPGGQLLMMLPLATMELLGTRFFEPTEHVYIHEPSNLATMLYDAEFDQIAFDRWTLGHDTVSARRCV